MNCFYCAASITAEQARDHYAIHLDCADGVDGLMTYSYSCPECGVVGCPRAEDDTDAAARTAAISRIAAHVQIHAGAAAVAPTNEDWRTRAARLRDTAKSKAEELAAESTMSDRLRELLRMGADERITPEVLLLKVVRAVRGDETKERSRHDVETAAKWRQRAAGLAVTVGGPLGAQVFGLYGEAAIFCDVERLHELGLTDEQVAAHLLVFWNAVSDYDGAHAAIARGDSSLARIVAAHVRGAFSDKPIAEMTKRDAVLALWKARGVVSGGLSRGEDPRRRDVLLPGGRVRQAILAAERQYGIAAPPSGGLLGRFRKPR